MFKFFTILFVGLVLLGNGCAKQAKVSEPTAPSTAINQPMAPVEKTETNFLPKPKPVIPADTPKAPTATVYTVKVSNFSFSPAKLTINKGDKVIWQHDDAVAHTIVSVGNFSSPVLSRGDKFDFVFNQAGEFNYYCSIHPSMTGKIIVK
ncbi:MAG: cupredoxin domain-containing protein [Candidatus Magasanikbacteria bacterium]|nr:cupredoxin domain-containing protein [Candidatus Magasanikbacteria bacterium]